MWPVIPLSLAATLFAVTVLLALFAAVVVAPSWGRSKRVRMVVIAAFAPLAVGLLLWCIGTARVDHGICHRPEGHGPAAKCGFDLTLSGHTHGGQIGWLGRSILERIDPTVGWWGSYEKPGPRGPSRLYTTSGAGHWLPFRVGCPTEIPLIVLERA